MNFEEMNVNDVINALIADDPELAFHTENLKRSFMELKSDAFVHKTIIELPPVVETRQHAGLSQRKFAEKLGISVNTLRSWEQGQRQPSGAAATLLRLLSKRPELIEELGQA